MTDKYWSQCRILDPTRGVESESESSGVGVKSMGESRVKWLWKQNQPKHDRHIIHQNNPRKWLTAAAAAVL